MNLLLDTHVLIWWFEGSKHLGPLARAAFKKTETEVWISAASVREISIKTAIGRLKLSGPAEQSIGSLLDQGFHSLPVEFRHAFAVSRLPLHHTDPFDRVLIAQAQCDDLTIVTADRSIPAYDVRTIDASA